MSVIVKGGVLLVAVLIHETGHLVFGLITGYRFVSFKFLWFMLADTGTGKKLSLGGMAPPGQCLMYPAGSTAVPLMMILGGPLANLVSGMIFIICGFSVTGIVYRIIALYFGAAGIAVGIYNLFWGSVYSDGYTYREIKRDKDLGRIYNNIMLIYRELIRGRSYEDMPDHLFKLKAKGQGPLYDEMREHIKRRENGCSR